MSFRLGANDIGRARAFYDATLQALGGEASRTPASAPIVVYRQAGEPALVLGPARNGEPATAGNGGTMIFSALDEAALNAWHAAGLAHGGACEGPPGPRPQAGGKLGAYLRDPDGNKLGCYVGQLFG